MPRDAAIRPDTQVQHNWTMVLPMIWYAGATKNVTRYHCLIDSLQLFWRNEKNIRKFDILGRKNAAREWRIDGGGGESYA